MVDGTILLACLLVPIAFSAGFVCGAWWFARAEPDCACFRPDAALLADESSMLLEMASG